MTNPAFSLATLPRPVIQAPMAGGPSTPALAAAVSEAGGLGFLAAGYLSAEALAEQIAETRNLTARPFGVNVFVPESDGSARADLDGFARALGPWAERFGIEAPGIADYSDDAWDQKIELLLEDPVPAVSFTFGLPEKETVRALQAAGTWVALNATSTEEAQRAAALGPDALVIQSHEAGGHRATLSQRAPQGQETLTELLRSVREIVDLPLVAAGGTASSEEVREALEAGASAVQAGTAFALAEEAGTNPVHRHALEQAEEQAETVVTRVFSGRPARALANEFTRELGPRAVAGYPQVHFMTSPIRAASRAAEDPEAVNLWAGTGVGRLRSGTAAEILRRLAP